MRLTHSFRITRGGVVNAFDKHHEKRACTAQPVALMEAKAARSARGRWKADEDLRLLDLIAESPCAINWDAVSATVGSRSPIQCKRRYHSMKRQLGPGLAKMVRVRDTQTPTSERKHAKHRAPLVLDEAPDVFNFDELLDKPQLDVGEAAMEAAMQPAGEPAGAPVGEAVMEERACHIGKMLEDIEDLSDPSVGGFLGGGNTTGSAGSARLAMPPSSKRRLFGTDEELNTTRDLSDFIEANFPTPENKFNVRITSEVSFDRHGNSRGNVLEHNNSPFFSCRALKRTLWKINMGIRAP